MSILIKDMDMPKSCQDCELAKHFDGYYENDCPFNAFSFYDCPLVEVPVPHGRLIDADALEKAIYEWVPKVQETWAESELSLIEILAESVLLTIEEQPTIIEAEEGDNYETTD